MIIIIIIIIITTTTTVTIKPDIVVLDNGTQVSDY